MTSTDSAASGRRPTGAAADPLQMSLAEKLAAEWEARHDVAARGRLGDPAAVQHYLSHLRCEQHPGAGAPPHPAGSRAARRQARAAALRQWLRWGEDDR